MRWIGILLLLVNVVLCTGCDSFAGAQLQLVQQARKGLELENQNAAERAEFVSKYYATQRDRLDTAFDADVRQSNALSSDWVIEHRRAYSAALDAINRQQNIAAGNEATAARNRVAIDLALERLESLISIELRLWPTERGR